MFDWVVIGAQTEVIIAPTRGSNVLASTPAVHLISGHHRPCEGQQLELLDREQGPGGGDHRPCEGRPFLGGCHNAVGEAAGPGRTPSAKRGRTTWRCGKMAATLRREEGQGPTIAGETTAPEGHLIRRKKNRWNTLTQRGFCSVMSSGRTGLDPRLPGCTSPFADSGPG